MLEACSENWALSSPPWGYQQPTQKSSTHSRLHQFKDEVTAALQAQKYEQESKSNPLKRLKMHNKAYKRVMRHGYRKEPLSRAIAQEGPKLLEEIIPKNSEEKGRRTITWKLLRCIAGSVVLVDSIMTKVEALQTSFYLRFSYTCQLRNIENG